MADGHPSSAQLAGSRVSTLPARLRKENKVSIATHGPAYRPQHTDAPSLRTLQQEQQREGSWPPVEASSEAPSPPQAVLGPQLGAGSPAERPVQWRRRR
jgi:hypothetical protein